MAAIGQLGRSGEEQGLARVNGRQLLVVTTRKGWNGGHQLAVVLSQQWRWESPEVRVHRRNLGRRRDSSGEGAVRPEEDSDGSGRLVREEDNVSHSGGSGS